MPALVVLNSEPTRGLIRRDMIVQLFRKYSAISVITPRVYAVIIARRPDILNYKALNRRISCPHAKAEYGAICSGTATEPCG